MPQASATREKLLNSALHAFRLKGYAATSVDDICREAGVTKGAFFHHFKGKEELAVASTEHWTAVTGALFAGAQYHAIAQPRARVLAYIDFRSSLIQGDAADFTCLLGTLVQETYSSHPAIRDACSRAIDVHAGTVGQDLAAAKRMHAPRARWDPAGVALYIQATIQGAFILAKARGDTGIAQACLAHLRAYIASLLPMPPAAAKLLPGGPRRARAVQSSK
jgi:TetR/AcrR family transcriptional repressor of nem operon